MNIKEEFKRKHKEMNIYDQNDYSQSFDYIINKQRYRDLNFLYIVSENTFKKFRKEIGLYEERHLERTDKSSKRVKVIDNNDLLNKKKIESLEFKTDLKEYEPLNYIISENISANDLIYLNKECFNIMRKVYPDLRPIKKVVYQEMGKVRLELFNPIINVLLISNKDLENKKITKSNLKRFIVPLSISQYMNGNDLKLLITEVISAKGYKNSREFQILIPDIDDVQTRENDILKGNIEVSEIKKENLSVYDVYDKKLIICYFNDGSSDWKIRFKIDTSNPPSMEEFEEYDLRASRTFSKSIKYTSLMEEGLSDLENAGIVGLNNIGNTCYMNSVLQCLFHTKVLKFILLDPQIKEKINHKNPLGTRGKMLLTFAELFKIYWKTKEKYFSPSKFKLTVGKYLPLFSGNDQHDSQEFLSQFLDILHEDMNIVINKPATKAIEGSNKEDDKKIAKRSWINFLKRNSSVFVENFYGQFKTTINCPQCKKTSITFDPYQIISLNIPCTIKHKFTFFFITKNHTKKAIKFHFTAKGLNNFNKIKISDIIKGFSKELGISFERLSFVFLGFSKVGQSIENESSLSEFYYMLQSFATKPKIFLQEMTDQDLLNRKSLKPVEIFLRTNYEIHDPDYTGKFKKPRGRKNDFEKDPIFTKYFVLTASSTVKELYQTVIDKFDYALGLTEKLGSSYDRELLFNKLVIEADLFYLKIKDRVLGPEYMKRSLKDFLDKKSKSLIVNIYIRMKSEEIKPFNLDKFLSCATNRDIQPDFKSPDLKNLKTVYKLEELLDFFMEPEILDNQNKWYCSKCKDHVRAHMKIGIYKAPKYLIIQFKKMKSQGFEQVSVDFKINNFNLQDFVINKEPIQGYNIKIEDYLSKEDFSQIKKKKGILDFLNDPINPSLKYDLYGVVNHFGSQYSGHYTCFTKASNNKWYEFDDCSVHEVREDDVVTKNAYILFYKKRV